MTVTVQPGGTSSGSHAKLQAGVALGDYVLGQPLWPVRIADAYRANGPTGPATIYVIHGNLARTPEVRDQIIAGTRAAAALPEHKHLVRTLAAGLTGEVLWIATEDIDGSLVRDMLIKKRQAGTSGFGVRGTGNLITGVASALGDALHGALSAESVIVNRTGRVKVTDLALGSGTLAAMRAGLIPMESCIAPEAQQSGVPSRPGDVYAVGALLYEALVGSPLERGGPRPSEVVQGTTGQIDEIVARACHRDPEKRFGRTDVLGEVVAEALGQGGAVPTGLIRKVEPSAGASLNMKMATATDSGAIAASGNAVVDRALAAALADNAEKFLISKGRLDYGPFSLADVVAQIEKGDIVAGNIIMDKDTGARSDVGEHPLLGPIVDATRARMDDQRRAQAEARVQSSQTKKGAVLYAFIALGVLGAAAAVWFIIQQVRGDEKKEIAGVSQLEGSKLDIKISLPKVPPAKKRPRGGGGGGGSIKDNYSENLALDLSDDSDETETLGMDKVYAVYSSYGRQLAGCLGSNGGGSANIGIIIDGPSGRVRWVKVNGQQSGGLYNCINRVMRSMQFPKINGPRTRAEFDIGV